MGGEAPSSIKTKVGHPNLNPLDQIRGEMFVSTGLYEVWCKIRRRAVELNGKTGRTAVGALSTGKRGLEVTQGSESSRPRHID